MGWSGYGIYDGDDTQTCHYDFIKWAKVKVDDDTIMEWMSTDGTIIPSQYRNIFIKGIPKIIKKMPSKIIRGNGPYANNVYNEDRAIEWQMLMAICLDNKIKPPKIVYDFGKEATEYLMGSHASDFCNPSARRYHLKKFLKKLKKNGYEKKRSIKATVRQGDVKNSNGVPTHS